MHERKMTMDELIPLALIVKEMIINTVKHALPFLPECRIYMEFNSENNQLQFIYSDNGPGLAGTDINTQPGTGIRLIRNLAKQMNANIQIRKKERMEYVLVYNRN